MTRPWTLVDTPATLASALEAFRGVDTIALDTEYDSFRYFRDRLCLIQLQAGAGAWLVDPLAGLDLAGLGDLFGDPRVLKILHAGDNDVRILRRDYGFAFRNLFDTHQAGAVLGHRQLGLGRLVEAYLGVTLPKTMQRSRWDLRPLSEAQLDYAARDTGHLPELCRRLEAELREKGLLEEARRRSAGIAEVVWQPKVLDPIGHRRLPGYGALDPGQRERARRLYRWRFEKGREMDRAPFMVLADPQLLALARLEEPTPAALARAGILKPGKGDRYAAELLTLLQRVPAP